MIKQITDDITITLDDKITYIDIANLLYIFGKNYIKETFNAESKHSSCFLPNKEYNNNEVI